MQDLIQITDIIKYVLNIPLNIFGFQITLLSAIIGTLILSVAITFVVKVFGGE